MAKQYNPDEFMPERWAVEKPKAWEKWGDYKERLYKVGGEKLPWEKLSQSQQQNIKRLITNKVANNSKMAEDKLRAIQVGRRDRPGASSSVLDDLGGVWRDVWDSTGIDTPGVVKKIGDEAGRITPAQALGVASLAILPGLFGGGLAGAGAGAAGAVGAGGAAGAGAGAAGAVGAGGAAGAWGAGSTLATLGLTAGLIGSNIYAAEQAGEAVDAQTRAGELAIEEQRAAREQARADLQPFREAGAGVLPDLVNQVQTGDYERVINDPLYQALLEDSTRNIEASAAAGGKLGTGDTLKDLQRSSLGIGYDMSRNRTNELFNLVTMGQNAAAGQGTATLQTGSNISGLQTQIGNVQGAGEIAKGNAATNLFNQGVGLYEILNEAG